MFKIFSLPFSSFLPLLSPFLPLLSPPFSLLHDSCDQNTYADQIGTPQPGTNLRSCTACPPGKAINDPGTDEKEHDEESDCKVPTLVFSCPLDRAQRPIADTNQCEDCPPGHKGDGRGESCVLCPVNQYQDESGQKQCKECTTDLCAAVPGATTNQAEGGDTLQEEYSFVTNISSSLIDAVIVTNLYDGEKNKIGINVWETSKYAWYFSLSIPPLSIVMLHRYLPLCFKNLDLLFAGSNFIEDTVSDFLLHISSACFQLS